MAYRIPGMIWEGCGCNYILLPYRLRYSLLLSAPPHSKERSELGNRTCPLFRRANIREKYLLLARTPCAILHVRVGLDVSESTDSVFTFYNLWNRTHVTSVAARAALLKPTQLQRPRLKAVRRPVAACFSAGLILPQELSTLPVRSTKYSDHRLAIGQKPAAIPFPSG